MSIQSINDLALELVARDFSDGHKPTNAGPTKTSRALAIIHLAAHDAYAKVTEKFDPRLDSVPNPPPGIGNAEATGTVALIGAGIRAALILYPDEAQFIAAQAATLTAGADLIVLAYGEQVANAWLCARTGDGSEFPQLDDLYVQEPGHHRRDPLDPMQKAMGRQWGKVKPFVLGSVVADAPLEKQPSLDSDEYALAFNQVIEMGKDNTPQGDSDSRRQAAIGIFWAYDGANKLGTPPRLYNQVVRHISGFNDLPHDRQVRVLTALNVAMADAGIAAWYWKYEYDFWRPVVAIREADAGFGPTGKGDGNPIRKSGDPFWLPLGAPKSNPSPVAVGASGSNFTPNFPAYPSGHATFGSAGFETVAALLGKTPEEITVVDFVSDEFNGKTTDNRGVTRPRWEQTFTLREAIEQNKISRVYLGVHWAFDATGGELVGKAVADKVAPAFK